MNHVMDEAEVIVVSDNDNVSITVDDNDSVSDNVTDEVTDELFNNPVRSLIVLRHVMV